MALEMFEAENMADDELQEQIELQDGLVQAAYDHNKATLALVKSCITHEAGEESDSEDYRKGTVKRIGALSRVEDCLFYYEGETAVDLKKFVDVTLSDLLKESPLNSDTVITINEVIPRLITAEFASPLALILFELLENCVSHAFDEDSPANYIRVKMDLSERVLANPDTLDIIVSDSGVGLSGDPEQLVKGHNGLAIARALVDDFGGTLAFTFNSGTIVSASIPIPPTIDF